MTAVNELMRPRAVTVRPRVRQLSLMRVPTTFTQSVATLIG
jgi:hypothetical protein